jgi:hypothetical protein
MLAAEGVGITAATLDAMEACTDQAMLKIEGLDSPFHPKQPNCPAVNTQQITAKKEYFSCRLSVVMAAVGAVGGTLGNIELVKKAKGAVEALTEAGLEPEVAAEMVKRLQDAGLEKASAGVNAENKFQKSLQGAGQHLMGKTADERTTRFVQLVGGLDDKAKNLLKTPQNQDDLLASIGELDDMYKGKVPADKLNRFMKNFVQGQDNMDGVKGYNQAIKEAKLRHAGNSKKALKKHLEEYVRETVPEFTAKELDEIVNCAELP